MKKNSHKTQLLKQKSKLLVKQERNIFEGNKYLKKVSIRLNNINNLIMEINDLRTKLSTINNGLALGAVADFGAKNCQVTTKADAIHNVQLTTKTAIEPNACYALVAVY